MKYPGIPQALRPVAAAHLCHLRHLWHTSRRLALAVPRGSARQRATREALAYVHSFRANQALLHALSAGATAPTWRPLAPRELSTVLAALRLWQHCLQQGVYTWRSIEVAELLLAVATDRDRPALTAEEIDVLCEQFNLGPKEENPL